MKVLATAFGAAALLCASAAASAGTTNFNAAITGDQEVPGSGSAATGTMTGVYDDIANTFAFEWDIMNLEGTPADPGSHIHNAPAGANGPIVFGFNNPDGSWPLSGSATWMDVPSDMVDALFAGELYINFHTDQFPGGEVRGQIIPAPTAAGLIGIAGIAAARRRR